MSVPTVKVLVPTVPVEWVRLPDPVNEPTDIFVLIISNVPLVMVSNPEIDVVLLNLTPVLLLIVRLAGIC